MISPSVWILNSLMSHAASEAKDAEAERKSGKINLLLFNGRENDMTICLNSRLPPDLVLRKLLRQPALGKEEGST